MSLDRRKFIQHLCATTSLTAASGALGLLAGCASAPGQAPLIGSRASELLPRHGPRVVVIGAGYGGSIAAKYIRRLDPGIEVVLIERNRTLYSGPFSNLVLGGIRELDDLRFAPSRLAANHGIQLLHAEVRQIEPASRTVVLDEGILTYDRLILSPGIDFRFDEIEGYAAHSTPQEFPHAWQPGAQTALLRRQLLDLPDGGTVLETIPLAPYRCPPGPYERASMIAMYLKQYKPHAKLIVLDANPDITSKGPLFRKGWARHYADIIEYRPVAKVTALNARQRTVLVEGLDAVRGDVINLIPPQRAGVLANRSGLVSAGSHWCPVNPHTFESTLASGIHVIGDACAAGAMPKSGYSANTQAKICAVNLVALMNGQATVDMSALNVCYSFLTRNEAISVAAVYRVTDGKIVAVPNSGGISADLSTREAIHAAGWLQNMLTEMTH